MKKYDVIIPLGELCATAVALRDSGLRQNSYPFDWSGGVKYDKCGNCGFIGKIKMICNDFKDAFNLEDLEEFWSENKGHRGVINKRTGLQYLHDFNWEQSVEAQYPEYIQKYQRRIKRLYDDINTNKTILFIFATRGEHKLSLAELNNGLNLLNNKFPQKDINFLLIQDSTDCAPFETKYFEISDNIFVYLYRDASVATGNQTMLKKIMKDFIIGTHEYNFATNNIKNYGLSVKENWGRWSDGQYVWLDIPIYKEMPIKIKFDVLPYIVASHPVQDVDIYLHNNQIAHWHFEITKPMPDTTLDIPAKEVKGGNLTLKFKVNNPMSIQELGLGNDTRKLGIGFKKMEITEYR